MLCTKRIHCAATRRRIVSPMIRAIPASTKNVLATSAVTHTQTAPFHTTFISLADKKDKDTRKREKKQAKKQAKKAKKTGKPGVAAVAEGGEESSDEILDKKTKKKEGITRAEAAELALQEELTKIRASVKMKTIQELLASKAPVAAIIRGDDLMQKQQKLMEIVGKLRAERPVEAAIVDQQFKDLSMNEALIQVQQDMPEVLMKKNSDLDVFDMLAKFQTEDERNSPKMQSIRDTLVKEEKVREDTYKREDELRTVLSKTLPDMVTTMRNSEIDDENYLEGVPIDDPAITQSNIVDKATELIKMKDELMEKHKNSEKPIEKERHIAQVMKEQGMTRLQAEGVWNNLTDMVWHEKSGRELTAEDQPIIESFLSAEELYQRSSIGKIIRFSSRDVKINMPEGWCGSLGEREIKNTGQDALLIRPSTIELIDRLRLAEQSSFTNKTDKPILLHGEPSCGKSANLQHAIYYARKSGWIVFPIKSMLKLVHSGGFIEKSKYFPDCWDQPYLAGKILATFLDVHGDKLKAIPLKTKMSLPKFDGFTLFDLVEYGAALLEMSSTVMWAVVQELKRVYEFPVLLVVDDYNVVYNYNQAYRDPDSKHFYPRKLQNQYLTLCLAFKDLHEKNPLVNGNVLLATTHGTTLRHFPVKEMVNPRKCDILTVPTLDAYDVDKLMSHWQRTKFVYADTNQDTRRILAALSGGRGEELARFCKSI